MPNTQEKIAISEYAIGKQKYKIVSHFIGEKNIDEVLENLAVKKALYEYNYGDEFLEKVC